MFSTAYQHFSQDLKNTSSVESNNYLAMETSRSYNQKTLISELIQGANFAKQLKSHLNSAEIREVLIQEILASYEKSLFILRWTGHDPRTMLSSAPAAVSGITESPMSVNGRTRSEGFRKGVGTTKRKMLPTWTDHVRINPETGLEGPKDDVYNWRKYGQKDILGAKHPRSYYRCTYRDTQNCWATKQVQRSDEDPTVFEVTYKGQHNCINGGGTSKPTTSPKKQETNQNPLTRFKTGLTVETENLDSNAPEMTYPVSFPPSREYQKTEFTNPNVSPSPFMSPSTPESNYFSHCSMNVIEQNYNTHHYESDLTDIVSATTSTTNSPIVDFDWQLEAAGIDPNFLFDTTAFLP